MSVSAEQIQRNLDGVMERISRAAEQSGRKADSVRLVGVTKYVGVEEVHSLAAAGCTTFGESRPQSLWDKTSEFQTNPTLAVFQPNWHFIGHLQRNKVRRTLPMIELLHAGDSLRLLEAVNQHGSQADTTTEVLIEVNISGDENKHGFSSENIESALLEMADWKNIRIRGLMGMASLSGGNDQATRDFEALRELRDRLATIVPASITLDELSMGMSGDFECAIAEGATIVRVGSALFESD